MEAWKPMPLADSFAVNAESWVVNPSADTWVSVVQRWRDAPHLVPVILPADPSPEAHEHAHRWAQTLRKLSAPPKIPICNEELPNCNDNCLHCGVADIMRTATAMPYSSVLRHIHSLYPVSGGRIMFAVSELTIRSDFFSIVAACKRRGYRTIAVVTNGRRLAYPEAAQKAVQTGVTHFLVSIYGPTQAVHEGITRTPGSFAQTVAGIANLIMLPTTTMTNTVITRRNAQFLPEIVDFLADLGVKNICLSFVQIIGNAKRFAHRLVPRMADVVPRLLEAIDRAVALDVRLGIGGLPYCLLPNHDALFGVDDLTYVFNGEPDDQITHRSPYEQADVCLKCAYSAICPGVQQEYLDRFGSDELRPFPGPKRVVRPKSILATGVFPDLFDYERPRAAASEHEPRNF